MEFDCSSGFCIKYLELVLYFKLKDRSIKQLLGWTGRNMNGSYNYFHQIWWAMYKRWAKIISYLYRLNLFQQYKLLVSIKDLLKKKKIWNKNIPDFPRYYDNSKFHLMANCHEQLTWKRQPKLFTFDSRRHRCKGKPPAYDEPLATKHNSRQKSRFRGRKVARKPDMLLMTVSLLKIERNSKLKSAVSQILLLMAWQS